MTALRRLSPENHKHYNCTYRVFCFPHAGGSASAYWKWGAEFGNNTEVFGIQYPGHFDRLSEAPVENLYELVDQLRSEIEKYTDLPIVLFGHSMGALISYLISSSFCISPLLLCVSGRCAPCHKIDTTIHLMSDTELLEELCLQGGTPPDMLNDNDTMRLFLPAIRADYKMSETFVFLGQPKPIANPIHLFYSNNDPNIDESCIEKWRYFTTSHYKKHKFQGGHFYLNEQYKDVVFQIKKAVQEYINEKAR